MLSFQKFLIERSIHYFDVDDTLSHTPDNVRIHVKNEIGKVVQSLTSQEFNNHTLPKNHSYDFSDFKSADLFKVSPVRPMLAKMKAIHKNGGKVEILTARSDFDDQRKFAQKWKSVGVDIDKIHVRRAGNLRMDPANAKAVMIAKAITEHGYKTIYLYDDSKRNIDAMLKLKKRFPGVTFKGYHIVHTKKGIKIIGYQA